MNRPPRSRLDDCPPLPGLTPRQNEIIALLVRGVNQREIAERLGLHHNTVNRHVANICIRLGAAGMVGLGVRYNEACRHLYRRRQRQV